MKKFATRAKELESLELITIDECVKRIQELYRLPEPPYKKQTMHKWISQKQINRYGPRHMALVDWNEVRRKKCS